MLKGESAPRLGHHVDNVRSVCPQRLAETRVDPKRDPRRTRMRGVNRVSCSHVEAAQCAFQSWLVCLGVFVHLEAA